MHRLSFYHSNTMFSEEKKSTSQITVLVTLRHARYSTYVSVQHTNTCVFSAVSGPFSRLYAERTLKALTTLALPLRASLRAWAWLRRPSLETAV